MRNRPEHFLARELNQSLAADGSILPSLLSARGTRAFFPSRGILGQSAEARHAAINATIGTALEDDGSALALDCLKDLVHLPSDAFLYAPSAGSPDLRRQWRAMLDEKNSTMPNVSCSLPVVTQALTHGLYLAGLLFVDPGESIILPDLYWDNYELLFVEGCGANFATFDIFADGGYNVPGMRRLLMQPGEKKILLLNFPNNPTGYTATESEATAIVEAVSEAAAAGKHIVVLLDDAYFGLVYEPGVYRQSLFPLLAQCHPNVLAIKLDGPTKEDYVWGLRLGFITFGMQGATQEHYRALEDKTAGLVRATISSAGNLPQQLLLHGFAHDDYRRQKAVKMSVLKERYDRIKAVLVDHPEYAESFVPLPFNSGYFMCVRPRDADCERVRRVLLQEFDTGVIVLSGLIRLAFSSVPLGRIEPLFANLDAAIRKVKSEDRSHES